MELFQENVIVTANTFNVSLVSQLWLVNNRIVLEEEFVGSAMFTLGLVHVTTPRFSLLVIPNQVQFMPIGDEDGKQQLILERLGGFINLLPHTPYTALGVNFIWHYKPPENTTVAAIGRRFFFKENTPFVRAFDSDDAKFGAYFSKDVLGFRLKLSTTPVDVKHGDERVAEVLQFSFNYHLDSHNTREIHDALDRWHRAKEHSIALVNEFEAAL
jgi:hypothetical protein